MNFFDFIFGRKEGASSKEQVSSNNMKKEKVNENKPFQSVQPTDQAKSVNKDTEKTEIDYVEQFVKESVADLKKHTKLSTKELEAEAIYLAAFLYMKGTYKIDFKLDYLSNGLIDRIPSGNYVVADKVFSYMTKYGEGYYGQDEAAFGLNGYKMNIQMCSDYGNYIKNYFMRTHKIGTGEDFTVFSSPRNCLWRNGIKCIDSPTQREIYYKFKDGTFEFMIPPYNPLVVGTVETTDSTTIRCESNDGRRTFVFHFDGAIKPSLLDYIEMYRNDKGDMVSYHKD